MFVWATFNQLQQPDMYIGAITCDCLIQRCAVWCLDTEQVSCSFSDAGIFSTVSTSLHAQSNRCIHLDGR